jgi:hypothetical protein
LTGLGEVENVLAQLAGLLQHRLLGLAPESKVLEGAEEEALPLLPLRPYSPKNIENTRKKGMTRRLHRKQAKEYRKYLLEGRGHLVSGNLFSVESH